MRAAARARRERTVGLERDIAREYHVWKSVLARVGTVASQVSDNGILYGGWVERCYM